MAANSLCVYHYPWIGLQMLTVNSGWWSDIIPLRMVWFSGFWKLIGGGELAITSVILVIVADVFSEEER